MPPEAVRETVVFTLRVLTGRGLVLGRELSEEIIETASNKGQQLMISQYVVREARSAAHEISRNDNNNPRRHRGGRRRHSTTTTTRKPGAWYQSLREPLPRPELRPYYPSRYPPFDPAPTATGLLARIHSKMANKTCPDNMSSAKVRVFKPQRLDDRLEAAPRPLDTPIPICRNRPLCSVEGLRSMAGGWRAMVDMQCSLLTHDMYLAGELLKAPRQEFEFTFERSRHWGIWLGS